MDSSEAVGVFRELKCIWMAVSCQYVISTASSNCYRFLAPISPSGYSDGQSTKTLKKK